jgi:predicted Zn-dependent peptidase
MTARLAGVLVLGLWLAGCAAPGSPPAPTAAAQPTAAGPMREVLPNGVVLIAQDHRAADVVAVQLWMRVGGRDERPDELGLSHYMEHMLFKGTPTRPPGSIDRLIEGLGGTSNAFTSYDFTHFDIVVPAAHVRTALEVLADIAVNAAFVVEELEAEKKVVFEEMNLTEDDPEKFLARRLSEVAYQGHPYGRPILGTRELIESLTRDRLNAYYKKHYIPRNMAVVVVGPVKPEEVRALTAQTFGRLAGPPSARPPAAPVPPLTGGRTVDVPRPEQQAYLGLAWQAAATGVASQDISAVDLLTYILGDGPSSRLNQTVREDKRLVQSIEGTYVTRELSGLVSVSARLDPKDLGPAEAAIREVVRRVRADGVSETERQRAIITAESFYAFDIETAEGLAKSYGQAETTWTLDNELRYLERLRQVTGPQIQAAARTYLGDDGVARVRFVPKAPR